MADPRFYDNRGPFSRREIAKAAGLDPAAVVDGDGMARDMAGIEDGGEGAVVFATTRVNLNKLNGRAPAAVLVPGALAEAAGAAAIVCPDPAAAFGRIAAHFYPGAGKHLGPRDGSYVDATARIGAGVTMEAGVVIGPDAEIGEGTHLAAHCYIGRGVRIGRGSIIGPQVSVIYALLGDQVILHGGVRIGFDGFGFAGSAQGHVKIPQLGRVIIQDKVEIGANSCVDRGALGDTVIGEGVKIDNLVQIGHNCQIGRHAILVSQVGLSGSVSLGDFVVMGGQSAAADHVTIGPGARFAARSGISKSLAGGADYGGAPAQPVKDWKREVLALRRLAKGKTTGDE